MNMLKVLKKSTVQLFLFNYITKVSALNFARQTSQYYITFKMA